ncbi:putative leucine Rich repeat-containing domain protein [Trichinella nativa]|uniref:Putative leucine Rich repeat-containing domain protein n=1 Tax=Trichinella nativa TaxID=6335 RepID=A0A1Y3EHS3_9BILA|nr:putative leucine Rich repeat-containing domain protein [Trichinella nativa]
MPLWPSSDFHASNVVNDGAVDEGKWPVGRCCPRGCQCGVRYSEQFRELLKTVDCFNAGLQAFPENLPSDTQALLLRHNGIRLLPGAELWLPDLVQLDLSHNRLNALVSQDFHEHVFDGMYNLRSLDLSSNELRRLCLNDFRGLFNLEELNLADNRISSAADGAFHGLLKLETLRLSGNRFTFVQAGWFDNLPTLRSLALNRNYLTLLTADNFRSLSQLVSLDLSKNRIFRIHDTAFNSLNRLDVLRLSGNTLVSVPRRALHALRQLRSINLSQNPIFRIQTDDLADLPQLRDVNFSAMQRLRLVDRGAFKNLPNLLVVDLHDNPYLGYVDRLAFVNTPAVSHLFLHNNNLTVLESDVLDALPALQEMSLYGNPIRCDCNVRWLRQRLSKPGTVVYHEADRIVCDSPMEHKYKQFTSLNPDTDLPSSCAPRILYMFDPTNKRAVSESIMYDCRAVGEPRPKIQWFVGVDGGRPIESSVYHPRRRLVNGQTLSLDKLQADDANTYTCVAENPISTAKSSTTLQITTLQVRLHISTVTSTTVTITWNGSSSDSTVFQIFYRPVTSQQQKQQHQYAGTVTPAMHTYTVHNLRPNTMYDLCMAVEDSDDVMVNLSCKRVGTEPLQSQQSVEHSDRLVIEPSSLKNRNERATLAAVLGAFACSIILLCLVAVAVSGYRAIQRRQAGQAFSRLSDLFSAKNAVASLEQLATLKANGYTIGS